MDALAAYWPLLLSVVAVVLGAATAIHAAMTKDDVRAAIGWVGMAMLSPFVGAFLYFVAGVNRVHRRAVRRRRARTPADGTPREGVSQDRVEEAGGPQFRPLRLVGDSLGLLPMTDGNRVRMLSGGDETYAAMTEAIAAAHRSIGMQTYIFDADAAGLALAEALGAAVRRGVEVRVLIDAVGARYSRPPITRALAGLGVPHALFLGNVFGLRLPYANLRSHRKVMVIDGDIGFTGGMNVRAGFVRALVGESASRDAHFRLEGPVVSQLSRTFAHDWLFAEGERLSGPAWAHFKAEDPGAVLCRPVDSGPDEGLERTHNLILGALSVAQTRVRIASPYFIPDARLVAALGIAARRGVEVDIVIPFKGNLRMIDWAIAAQLDQVLAGGCRVWRATGPFDHAKLMVVDSAWALVGSSNLDPRSLRLNFELDVEIVDRETAAAIEARIEAQIADARPETLATLAARPALARLRNRIVWLASPYL